MLLSLFYNISLSISTFCHRSHCTYSDITSFITAHTLSGWVSSKNIFPKLSRYILYVVLQSGYNARQIFKLLQHRRTCENCFYLFPRNQTRLQTALYPCWAFKASAIDFLVSSPTVTKFVCIVMLRKTAPYDRFINQNKVAPRGNVLVIPVVLKGPMKWSRVFLGWRSRAYRVDTP